MTHSLQPGNPSLSNLTGIKMSIEMYMNIYFSTVYRKKWKTSDWHQQGKSYMKYSKSFSCNIMPSAQRTNVSSSILIMRSKKSIILKRVNMCAHVGILKTLEKQAYNYTKNKSTSGERGKKGEKYMYRTKLMRNTEFKIISFLSTWNWN